MGTSLQHLPYQRRQEGAAAHGDTETQYHSGLRPVKGKEVTTGLLIYIRERRMALGLTQEDLAGRLGVDRSAVAYWEAGARTPTTGKLPQLAQLLGCGIEDLFRPPEDHADREEAS